MYNYIDEVPKEVQDRADEFFKWQEQYINKYKTKNSELNKSKEEGHTFVVDITTGFKTGFETHVKTVQVESRKELYELLEKWMRRSTADGCEFNYSISDCGGHDIPADEYETMENIYSDGTTEDLPF